MPNYPTFSVAVSNISRRYPELQFQLNSHFMKLISQQRLWDFQKKEGCGEPKFLKIFLSWWTILHNSSVNCSCSLSVESSVAFSLFVALRRPVGWFFFNSPTEHLTPQYLLFPPRRCCMPGFWHLYIGHPALLDRSQELFMTWLSGKSALLFLPPLSRPLNFLPFF